MLTDGEAVARDGLQQQRCQAEQDRLVYRARLRARYGSQWRRKAVPRENCGSGR
jgi:hypothetical protein